MYSMHVDVVLLRREGLKIPREEVLAEVPLRADLSVTEWPGMRQALLTFASAGASMHGAPRYILDDCRLWRLQGNSFVLVGPEWVGMYWERTQTPQAWWCRLVSEPHEPAGPADARLSHPVGHMPPAAIPGDSR